MSIHTAYSLRGALRFGARPVRATSALAALQDWNIFHEAPVTQISSSANPTYFD